MQGGARDSHRRTPHPPSPLLRGRVREGVRMQARATTQQMATIAKSGSLPDAAADRVLSALSKAFAD